MARIQTNSLITGISGKLCKHDDVFMMTNGQTGRIYTGRICNPFEGEASEKQMQVRNRFTLRAHAVKAWMEENKPTTSQPKGTEAYRAAYSAYKAQHKYGNFFAYCNAVLIANGTIQVEGIEPKPQPDNGNGGTGQTPTPQPDEDEDLSKE